MASSFPVGGGGVVGGTGGSSAYGTAPQPIGMPSSLYSQVLGANPTLGALGTPAANAISSEISGTLSPGTQDLLQNKAAAFGVNSGMPGLRPGSLALNNLLGQMGTSSEALSQAGIGSYGSILGTTANTMLDPSLTADVSEWNSVAQSAPDPQAAALRQQQLFQQYLQQMQGPQTGGAPPGSTNYQNILNALGPGTHPTGANTFTTPYYE
jgi:hypothetical protein